MSVNSKMTAIADAIRNLLDISGPMGLDAMASNISSIAKRGAVAGTISTKAEQYIIPAGYHNGNGTVGIADAEQAKIIAENIKSGVTILGVSGTASGEGAGAALKVIAPAGVTVTVSKDGETKTKIAGADGVAVFKGLATGKWTRTITDGVQTAEKQIDIIADYEDIATFFAATIKVTYPAGSTCTCTDGTTTLTAPDTTGTWECVVPNAGMWTVSLDSGFSESVEISTAGENKTIDKWYLYKDGVQHFPLIKYETYKDLVVFNDSSILLNGYSSGVPQVYTDKIKVNHFGCLKAKTTVYINGSGNFSIGLRQTIGPDLSTGTVLRKTQESNITNGVVAVDISSISSDHIVYFGSWNANASVYAIWLEV